MCKNICGVWLLPEMRRGGAKGVSVNCSESSAGLTKDITQDQTKCKNNVQVSFIFSNQLIVSTAKGNWLIYIFSFSFCEDFVNFGKTDKLPRQKYYVI